MKKNILVVLMFMVVLVLVSALSSTAEEGKPYGQQWIEKFDAEFHLLENWVTITPKDAQKIFEWDAAEPGQVKELVDWAIANPKASLDAFAEAHSGWPMFRTIMKDHRTGVNYFVKWCRRSPYAVGKLMEQPGALAWIGGKISKPSPAK